MLSGGSLALGRSEPPAKIGMEQHRWKTPFGPTPISPAAVSRIVSSPIFDGIEPEDFPDDLPFTEIIARDGRIIRFDQGDQIFSERDYGDSMFIVLRGHVESMTSSDDSSRARFATFGRENSWLQSIPIFNDVRQSIEAMTAVMSRKPTSPHDTGTGEKAAENSSNPDRSATTLGKHEVFGVSSALRRSLRGHTVVAGADNTFVFELRWPGVRDLRFWSTDFRTRMDALYQVQSCIHGLRRCSLFNRIDHSTLRKVAEQSVFETYGELGWSHRFQRHVANPPSDGDSDNLEPTISGQGEYLQECILVCSGFVRVSHKIDDGELTLGFLTSGDFFGLEQLIAGIRFGESQRFEYGLRACGYADVIRIPQQAVEFLLKMDRDMFGDHDHPNAKGYSAVRGIGLPQSLLDFIVDNRFLNGTSAMVIDTDRCVNCDDCVRACAATHDNIPRFVRQGKTHHNLMVANACMHCTDPVCMIDCPTGAIQRHTSSGNVVIDNTTCIGCGACASACPYGNIRMEATFSPAGDSGESGLERLTAIKCDLCQGQSSGPACKRACPHDAIMRIDLSNAEKFSNKLQVAR